MLAVCAVVRVDLAAHSVFDRVCAPYSDNSAEDSPARRHRRTAQFVWSPDQNPMPEAAQKELENVQAMTREMD